MSNYERIESSAAKYSSQRIRSLVLNYGIEALLYKAKDYPSNDDNNSVYGVHSGDELSHNVHDNVYGEAFASPPPTPIEPSTPHPTLGIKVKIFSSNSLARVSVDGAFGYMESMGEIYTLPEDDIQSGDVFEILSEYSGTVRFKVLYPLTTGLVKTIVQKFAISCIGD